MTPTNNKNDAFGNAFKSYISPILLSIVGMFIWRDLSEVRSDVKTLLDNQSANRVRIETLQADVSALKVYVYGNKYHSDNITTIQQPAKKEDELEIK